MIRRPRFGDRHRATSSSADDRTPTERIVNRVSSSSSAARSIVVSGWRASGPISVSETAPTRAVPLVAGFWRANAPVRDPVGDDRGEQFGELGADHEAERLGSLAGRLGDHRVGEPPRSQCTGREQLDRLDQPVGRRAVRSGDGSNGRQLASARLANDLGDQVVARREVAVHRADRDAGPRGDRRDRGPGEAGLPDDVTRRGQDRRPRPFVPFTRRRRSPVRHPRSEPQFSSCAQPTPRLRHVLPRGTRKT